MTKLSIGPLCKETTRSWVMQKASLAEALKRCAIMAKGGSQRVTLASDGDIATLTSKSEGMGDAKEEVQIVKEGDHLCVIMPMSNL